MKKIVFSLLAAALAFSATSQEITVPDRKNFFCIGPFDLFLNTLQLSYERQLKNNSVAVMGGFKLSQDHETLERLGANAEVQYRISLLYNKQNHVIVNSRQSIFPYFAPYIHYRYEEIYLGFENNSVAYVNSGFTGLGFGIRLTGMQNRFTANFFTGGGLKLSDVSGPWLNDGMLGVGYTGIAPKVACYIGIAF